MTDSIDSRQKYLRRVYREQAKAGASSAAIASAARLQATIEIALRLAESTKDEARRTTLLKVALESESRLHRLMFALEIVKETTLRRRSAAEEKAERRREAYRKLTGKEPPKG